MNSSISSLKNRFNLKNSALALSLLFTASSCSSLDKTTGSFIEAQGENNRLAIYYNDASKIRLIDNGKEVCNHDANMSNKEALYAMNYFFKTGEKPCETTEEVLAFHGAN